MRRIITAREQHEVLSPWHQAAADPYAPGPGQDKFSPTPHWFHASPYELEPGTVLTPQVTDSPLPFKSFINRYHFGLHQ